MEKIKPFQSVFKSCPSLGGGGVGGADPCPDAEGLSGPLFPGGGGGGGDPRTLSFS